jgi:hypothetical protein
VNGISTRRVKIESGGTGVVAHVGLHAVGSFADAVGLGDALSDAVLYRGRGIPVHDRGTVLVHTALMLAGGGESCLDIEHLRAGPVLFGGVASDTTVARTLAAIGLADRERVAAAVAPLRERVWSTLDLDERDPVLLDIDASIVGIHSENKENAAATFKGTYGFHPMMCFADATGETLAAVLRPGNAGANTVTDHLDVLDQAVAQLPAGIALGHRNGDDPTGVSRRVVVRADAAGCTEGFLGGCRARNIGFYVSARRNTGVHAAIFDAVGVDVWLPALGRDREPRDDGAVVAELTSLIDDPKLPAGTRLIVRREPLHPRSATQPVPIDGLPVLGVLHRSARRSPRPRRDDARSRACRTTHLKVDRHGVDVDQVAGRDHPGVADHQVERVAPCRRERFGEVSLLCRVGQVALEGDCSVADSTDSGREVLAIAVDGDDLMPPAMQPDRHL